MTQKDQRQPCRVMVENIRIPISAGEAEALAIARAKLRRAGCFGEVERMELHRRSIDARRKSPSLVCSVLAETSCAQQLGEQVIAAEGIRVTKSQPLFLPLGQEILPARPVIVGFGPAGIFCGLILAECGMAPLILEQGGDIEKRTAAVDAFLHGGALSSSTNIQFGAGGAGTFSDGKLTPRSGDSRGEAVLRRLCSLGAPSEILWKAKPHIGTDVLRDVIRSADRRIRQLGGEIRYHAEAAQIAPDHLYANGEKVPFGALVIACGHSSRALYGELLASGFSIEQKPFSVGVRSEHLQEEIDRAMYGEYAGQYGLVHAEYALSMRSGDRGVYSFCMCPGGEVVAAASEEGGVVTNGMSYHARDGRNANAALAVSVHPSDCGDTPQSSIDFQRRLEQAAFRAGGGSYAAPVQTVGDFQNAKRGTEPARILPTYRGGNVVCADLRSILPPFVSSMLSDGLRCFGRKIRGFDAPDVPMTGIETRTSAPVRILRDSETMLALGQSRIYPCGEGAGYAGGIMSAAVDGIRVAQAILARFARPASQNTAE